MGLGLCDSYTVDNFERNVMTKNIDYYDIWNYDNENDPSNKVGDNRLIKTRSSTHPESASYIYGSRAKYGECI